MLRWTRQRSSTTTGKKGHFARECTEPKKASILNNSAITYVCTHVFVAHTILGWIVDSRQTKHIASDRVGCVDCKKIPKGTQYVILGNRAQEKVIGVGTYQLKLRLGHTLLLHDMLHALGVQCNLFLVLTMLRLGFSFRFNGPQLDFYLNKTLYGHGYLSNDFFMLDLDHSSFSFIAHNDDVSNSIM